MWPFRRKAKPIAPPPMGETWRAGDIAEQIEPLESLSNGIAVGGVGYRGVVLDAGLAVDRKKSEPVWAIRVTGLPGWSDASAFRKIVDVGVEEPTRATAKRKEPA